MTKEDIILQQCLRNKQAELRAKIDMGRPYVWELRLSLDDFYNLETAVNNSIDSHNGQHEHLLTEDFAILVVMYLAEWYKRFYKGADTIDDNFAFKREEMKLVSSPEQEQNRPMTNKVLSLNTEELKKLYELAKIDVKTFVYNASKNPDKTSFRWLESLQVLGGLAVQAELKRDKTDPLLPMLCKIFHGEEIELDEVKDRNRAVAFQESISRRHSLYDYLDCILDKEKEMPFAKSDLRNEDTMIPKLLKRIESADEVAKKDKFDFEWIITYTASLNQMVRHLRVKLKPEVIGGGKKQYIGYDRLRKPQWGIGHPEEVGRIMFYLRFKKGSQYVKKESKGDKPLFQYHNTGSENTGFLSINKIDEEIYTNVPTIPFDKVEMVMRYGDKAKMVQELPVNDYLQVYVMPKSSTRFTSHRNAQPMTAVIFSQDYHLADEYKELPVVYAHFWNGETFGEDYCWCPINDKVVLVGADGKEVLPPFFNRSGLYQVVTKKYLKTIKYKDNLYVLYQYIDADYDEDEIQEDTLPVMFGREGLEVRHFTTGQSKEGTPVTEYDLEWLKGNRYVDWEKEEPEQGELKLRVTVKGMMFKLPVYYVPFSVTQAIPQPIWRDFEHHRICTALNGVENIEDDFKQMMGEKQPDTLPLEIGSDDAKILVDVYRPVILRELSQKCQDEDLYKVVGYGGHDDDVRIPLLNCEQFSLRDFSKEGVREYAIKNRSTIYYHFPTFNQTGLNLQNYLTEIPASELMPEIPLDYLKIYLTKTDDYPENLYAWDYKNNPTPVGGRNELNKEGVIFQSLKDDDSPRHYAMPTIKKGKSGWGGKKAQADIDTLQCFETVSAHKVYFFLFEPLVKCVAGGKQIKDIALPLVIKRNYQLEEEDIKHLYWFAVHFHFDWMLLPRDRWKEGIAECANSEEEQALLKAAVTDIFGRLPKSTDEREKACLEDFLGKYWSFDAYPKLDDTAETALKLILNNPETLMKVGELKDFLKDYDGHRFKFSEMSKVIATTE